jgi:hypothetical protein
MNFDHNALGRIGGYAVIDVLGTVALSYAFSSSARTPLLPTIAIGFVAGEVAHWALGVNTPLLTQAGVTFFPAPVAGRHLNNRACNCHS